jgi:hypothetical protein
MKRIILLLVFSYTSIVLIAQTYHYYSPEPYKVVQPTSLELLYKIQQQNNNVQLEDNWYNSTVEYSNSKTFTNATYSLKVYVSGNRVTDILFNNAGRLHTGLNNSNYLYLGGDLTFLKNYNNKIVSASTEVSIIYMSGSEGTKVFKIIIDF